MEVTKHSKCLRSKETEIRTRLKSFNQILKCLFRNEPNIFTPKSILRLQYGVLYEHIGQLYQGLQ